MFGAEGGEVENGRREGGEEEALHCVLQQFH